MDSVRAPVSPALDPAAVSPQALVVAGATGLGARLAIATLRGYQRFLSPLLAVLFRSGCRFHPTCSEYAVQAISHFGVGRGVLKTLRRLLRCHPFHPGGHDPLTY